MSVIRSFLSQLRDVIWPIRSSVYSIPTISNDAKNSIRLWRTVRRCAKFDDVTLCQFYVGARKVVNCVSLMTSEPPTHIIP